MGQKNQNGALANTLNARVIGVEQSGNSESKRSLLGKVSVERKQLGARKRVTEHQLLSTLDRQGRSLENEDRI